jgi:hypothetical protein
VSTFLRLELAGRDARPGDSVLVNVDHIARIHPTFPQGAAIVMDDDTTSLHVRASVADLQQRLCSTGGRTHVYSVDRPADPHKYALEHDADAIADELAAEEGYREMLAHPESVVDGSDLF